MPERFQPVRQGLSTQLLMMTVAFALVMQVLVYVPSLASFRENFLEERLASAQLAALALEAAPGNAVTSELEQELLATAGVIAIIMRRDDRYLMLGSDFLPEKQADADFDLREASLGALIGDALATLDNGGERLIRVTGKATVMNARWVEITLQEEALYEALNDYSNNILILSILVSVLTGALVYITLNLLLVRPMKRIKESIVDFRRNPEDIQTRIKAGRRRDEIGVVERELSQMQSDLRVSLVQRTKLAHVGEAVAKVTHDLRNILTTAQLASDVAVKKSDDPLVSRSNERLVTSLDRAVDLCESTMKYGKMDEPAPIKKKLVIKELIDDVAESLGLDQMDITFKNKIDPKMHVSGDQQQLFRAFLNLSRNALEAQKNLPEGREAKLEFRAKQERSGTTHISVIDHGMGLSEKAQENIFKPFLSSTHRGGTGLGLVIAKERVMAHGGAINLMNTGEDGSHFMVCLPK